MTQRARRSLLVTAAVLRAVLFIGLLVAVASKPSDDAAPPSEPSEAGCPDWPACP